MYDHSSQKRIGSLQTNATEKETPQQAKAQNCRRRNIDSEAFTFKNQFELSTIECIAISEALAAR